MFFYCGFIGHYFVLKKKKENLTQKSVMNDQYGYWLRAESRKSGGIGYNVNGRIANKGGRSL